MCEALIAVHLQRNFPRLPSFACDAICQMSRWYMDKSRNISAVRCVYLCNFWMKWFKRGYDLSTKTTKTSTQWACLSPLELSEWTAAVLSLPLLSSLLASVHLVAFRAQTGTRYATLQLGKWRRNAKQTCAWIRVLTTPTGERKKTCQSYSPSVYKNKNNLKSTLLI